MKTETKPEVTTKLPLILTAYPTAHQTIHSKVSDSILSVSTVPKTRYFVNYSMSISSSTQLYERVGIGESLEEP